MAAIAGNLADNALERASDDSKHPIAMAIHQSPSVYWGFGIIRIFCLIVFFI